MEIVVKLLLVSLAFDLSSAAPIFAVTGYVTTIYRSPISTAPFTPPLVPQRQIQIQPAPIPQIVVPAASQTLVQPVPLEQAPVVQELLPAQQPLPVVSPVSQQPQPQPQPPNQPLPQPPHQPLPQPPHQPESQPPLQPQPQPPRQPQPRPPQPSQPPSSQVAFDPTDTVQIENPELRNTNELMTYSSAPQAAYPFYASS